MLRSAFLMRSLCWRWRVGLGNKRRGQRPFGVVMLEERLMPALFNWDAGGDGLT